MPMPVWKYSWRQLWGDLCGGGVAALIALPYGLALATLMGLPPVLGLFTSFLTAPITAMLGRNPVLIGGTASATVPFIALAVKQQGIGGAAKISIVAAIFMMVFGLLKLGRYISKVPITVVSGFSCGIGAMMVIGQLRTILGVASPVDITTTSPVGQFLAVWERIGQTRLNPLVLGCVVILAAFWVARKFPKSPAPLMGVVLAFLISQAFGFQEKEVGRLPLEIPAFAGFQWTPRDIGTVVPSAFMLAVIASVNILITSRVVDHFRGHKTRGADTELGAYGIANLCAGIFGAPLSVGIPARSLANVRCGGSTKVSNVVHALFLLLFVSLGADFVAHIPLAALAGVTAYIGLCLLEWSTWRRLPRMRRLDAAAFLSTVVSVLFFNAVVAIAVGCSFYALHWLYSKAFAIEPPQAQQAEAANS